MEENVRADNYLNKILLECKEDPDYISKFCKARPVSYALNERIKK